MILAAQSVKFECLKDPTVLQLESLTFTPFHVISLIIFILAVAHTLCTYKIHEWARVLDTRQKGKPHRGKKGHRGFWIQILFFLSEVEVVFALWVIPLFLCISVTYGLTSGLEYINTRNYTEPLFVVIILSMASTRPIIAAAEKTLLWIAKKFGASVSALWFVLLTIGPILGSFITEPAAMVLCALLLSRQFYEYHPSPKLAYASLALLFVNISVGGILTDFASPAVLVLARSWHWSLQDIFVNFGWKAVLGILVSNLIYWFYFRKELIALNIRKKAIDIYATFSSKGRETPIPLWITVAHVFFMAWIVIVSHYPAIFIASFLFFIGFHQATRPHQHPIRLARPLLIGLFLAGLVIHGGLQGWWVYSMLKDLSPVAVMGVAMALTGFNDNAMISYLSTLIPDWEPIFEYAIFTGVIGGGGLTVIANSPNPAGYSILKKYFPDGLNPFKLLLGALVPTIILYLIFYFIGPLF